MRDGAALAQELQQAIDDPERWLWGASPWEHLGDAERDVRVLLAYIADLEDELAGSIPIEQA